MDDLGKCMLNIGISDFTQGFTWGLEVERHRIGVEGYLSAAPYPPLLGQQSANPYIKNDFFNTQSELITPVADSIGSATHYLAALDHTLRAALAPQEYLWPFSVPPRLTADHRELAYADVGPEKLAYYHELGRRYGMTEGLPSGIHVNLAPTTNWTQAIAQKLRQDHRQVRDELLLKQALGFMHYRWLFTYLNGASPIAEANYLAELPMHPVRSLRNSQQYGYGFSSHFKGDYTSVSAYVEKMQAAIATDDLLSESAFHEAVRLRNPAGLDALVNAGVSHIELRMLDLDPTAITGIHSDTLLLVQLLALYFMLTPKLDATTMQQAAATNDRVALEMPHQISSQQQAGLELLTKLQGLTVAADLPPIYAAVVTQAAEKMARPHLTLAGQLLPRINQGSLIDYGLQQARNFQLRAQLNTSPVYQGFQIDPHPTRAVLQHKLFDQYRELPRVNIPSQTVVSAVQ
ncbi:glutathione synthase [Loigolactobacillus zhaoyuanensis]|uniref:Glutamate--cysteine ligase n=1 Tax=Loigolactobacillus zhaoyuanensis TaxID=2486017 RepID=A0ABW8UEK1_9LACO|nr:glutathione synthase [Loigolactobacillus zhaoyuanensis]